MPETFEKILDLARWAPSGDNTQPWRFEIVAEDHIAIHGFDTREWCVYDFSGHASHMAHGALLETLRIAASNFGLLATWALRPGSPDTAPIYDVKLTADASLKPDPLFDCITARTVQRRPMSTRPLTEPEKRALEAAVGPGFRLMFFESFRERRRVATLLWQSAYLRLTCPEAYRTHKEIIEWGAQFSESRIPEQAVGTDPFTGKLMRWVLGSWGRVAFFNRYLFGTVAPRIQLDFLPGLACAAHVLLLADEAPKEIPDYVRAGAAMQRFWLTVTSLGLHLQPEMTPVIFRWYARAGLPLSKENKLNQGTHELAVRFEQLTGSAPEAAYAFFSRIGHAPVPKARSLRLPLTILIKRA